MNAKTLMTANPTVVTPDDLISRAAELMRNLDVGMVPVVDDIQTRRLVGVITDRDIVVRCIADHGSAKCQVRDHMTSHPLASVHEDTMLDEIAQKMEEYRVRRLPVVANGHRVVGIITQADLARRVGHDDPALIEEVIERISTPGALVH
ncbi:MAG TPA: CBS domain-containing protein [Gemmatimonadaceae bacterium]